MQAIEFEATPERDSIRLPEGVPTGIPLRVVLMWEPVAESGADLKDLFASVTEGLNEEELARPRDTGRADPSWDS
jgi:hypothetical protein